MSLLLLFAGATQPSQASQGAAFSAPFIPGSGPMRGMSTQLDTTFSGQTAFKSAWAVPSNFINLGRAT